MGQGEAIQAYKYKQLTTLLNLEAAFDYVIIGKLTGSLSSACTQSEKNDSL